MKNPFIIILASLFLIGACNRPRQAEIEGHYTYEHAFEYDMDGSHFDVHETGTMDFFPDGTSLDSARQVYTVITLDSNARLEGVISADTMTWVFNYISPSRWHLNGDTLFFAGIKESFRMTLIEGNDNEAGLAQKIIGMYGGSIDHEYNFHIDTLTADLLQWSFKYRDGHTDTWEFNRTEK